MWNVGTLRDADATNCVNFETLSDLMPQKVAHGEWIELPPACNGALLTKCSACNRIFTDIQLGMVKHFCPNCGTEMRRSE